MNPSFSDKLLTWHKTIDRFLPWKSSQDPYKIWLSEIILQQTRVEQGLPYYQKFVKEFPTVFDLANADLDEVLLLWQGLGYYSRGRNLHATAMKIVKEYDGVFPNDYKQIIQLKGIGEYTAAAILSFAFDAPYAVLDGNVKRVISRYFGITDPIDKPSTLKDVKALLNEVFIEEKPAAFNQAIMDFGALQCKPKSPNCVACPFNTTCAAFKEELVSQIPYKAKKIKKRNRYFHYFIVGGEQVLIKQRQSGDIWERLYDFPLIEKESDDELTHEEKYGFLSQFGVNKQDVSDSIIILHKKHILTHQNLFVKVYSIKLNKMPDYPNPYLKVYKSELINYAFPIVLSMDKMNIF